MTASRVVIVGASIAGLTAAETLRQEGFTGEIVLVGDEPHSPYNRPPLSKQILNGAWEPDQAMIRTVEELASLDIDLRTGCEATALDIDARIVQTTQGPLAFDELIIATGTAPRSHPLVPDAQTLRTLDDAVRLRDAATCSARVAVIGSGILGSEIASAARKQGAEVLLVGRSGALSFGSVGTLLSDRLAELHRDNGVELMLNAYVISSTTDGDETEIAFDTGETRMFDLVVTMIGGIPRTQWLASSGLDIAQGVACDIDGVAAHGISAIGDVAAWQDPSTGQHQRAEHQSYAIEQAISVATRLVHGTTSPSPVPLFWSEIHGTRINAYGWFSPQHPLVTAPAASDARGIVLLSRDGADQVRGAIGWNASPREFRTARASVVLPTPDLAPHH
ncbi:NAD(P)/FAD-dependent oxidoreductase [Microbacterium sp. A204]|uniref:NAD(P)/FAD-dependent oxidoreductase n=1 Tax=Microbacterium sp. A204 TaxID=3457321 RepID=UPI003FCF2E13